MENKVTTIEQTGKQWKKLYLLSFFLLLLAFFSIAISPVLVVLFIMAACCVYIVARVGAWWNHG